jgi:outer membrane lipoprotein-sorting protein
MQSKIDEILSGRSPADVEMVEQHILDCPDCRQYQQGLLENDSLLTGFVQSVDEKLLHLEGKIMESIDTQMADDKSPSAQANGPGWTGIFHSRFMKFAAAAVVLVAIIVAVNFIDRTGADIVWAEVIKQVEDAQDFICRIDQQNTGQPDLEIIHYQSAEHGMKSDMYRDDELVASIYFNFSDNEMCTLIHRDKAYTLIELSEEQKKEQTEMTAQNLITHLQAQEFEELGKKVIEGVATTGTRVKNPEYLRSTFDESEIEMWVDDRTNWPVLIKWEAVVKGGKIRTKATLDKFQWNPSLSQSDFEYEIPDDYKMIGRMDAIQKDESSAIEGLREYLKFSGGRYPSKLTTATAIHEMEDEIGERRDKGNMSKNDFGNMMKIQNACEFYADLVETNKDAAYYGDNVNPRDFDKVLLRWRLEDGRYRVIYGDLRAETVSAQRLSDLEGSD